MVLICGRNSSSSSSSSSNKQKTTEELEVLLDLFCLDPEIEWGAHGGTVG